MKPENIKYDKREENVKSVALFLHKYLCLKNKNGHSKQVKCGEHTLFNFSCNITTLIMVSKVAYIINAIVQLSILNQFFGVTTLDYYKLNFLMYLIDPDKSMTYFPRSAFCNVTVSTFKILFVLKFRKLFLIQSKIKVLYRQFIFSLPQAKTNFDVLRLAQNLKIFYV